MSVTREIIRDKIVTYLNGGLTKEKIYEWALGRAVAKDYEEVSSSDPLLHEVMQALVNINQEDSKHSITRDDLLYYKKCLEGAQEFEPLAARKNRIAAEQHSKDSKNLGKNKGQELYATIIKVYVVLFALCILGVYALGVLKPGIYRPGYEPPPRMEIILESLPHILYAIVLLLPMQGLACSAFYLCWLAIMVGGTVFYWHAAISIVLKFSLNPFLIVLFAPFTGVPALLALWLLISYKRKSEKS